MNTRDFVRQVPLLSWLIMLTVLCVGMFGNLLGSLTTEISASLTLTPKDIGWLIFFGNAGSAIGAFIGGDMAYRVQARYLISFYLLGMMAAIVLMVFSVNFTMLTAGFMFYEIMVVGMLTLGHTLIGQLKLVSSIRARVLALLDVGWSIGASMAPIWVIFFLKFYPSWRLPYGMFLLLVLMLMLAYHQPIIRRAIEQLGTPTHAAEQMPSGLSERKSHNYMQLIFAPWAIWAWIAGILIGYVEWGHTYWFVNYVHSGRDITLDQARYGLVGFTLGMVVARAWQAFIHSELRAEQRLNRLSLIGCVAFLLLAFLPNASSLWYLLMINFFGGIGIGIVFPILLNHLIDFSPYDTPKFSALLMLSIVLGAQLAGLVVGYIAEHLGIEMGYMSVAIAMIGFYIALMKLFSVHRRMKHAS